MNKLIFEGPFDRSTIIRCWIAKEYAFEIRYSIGVTVRVAFHKGTWHVVKLGLEDRYIDGFESTDEGGISCENPLLHGLIETTMLVSSKEDDPRNGPARIIESVLRIWAAVPEKIDKMICFQPGRNAFLGDAGEFILRG